MTAQTMLSRENVFIDASFMFFDQFFFDFIFSSIDQNVLDNHLISDFDDISNISLQLIQNTGAIKFFNVLLIQYHITTLKTYNDSLRVYFQIDFIMICLFISSAFAMKWRSVKKNVFKKSDDEKTAEKSKIQGDLIEKKVSEIETEIKTAAEVHEKKNKNRNAVAYTDVTHTVFQNEIDINDNEKDRVKNRAADKNETLN